MPWRAHPDKEGLPAARAEEMLWFLLTVSSKWDYWKGAAIMTVAGIPSLLELVRIFRLKQGFLIAELTFWGQEFFAVRGCPVRCRMLSSIHGLYPLDASGNFLPPHCDKKVTRCCQISLGQNHLYWTGTPTGGYIFFPGSASHCLHIGICLL